MDDRKIEGNLVVAGKMTFHGQVTGSVSVPQGATLELHGQVAHDLVIENGGVAIIRGQVCGNVVNRGGSGAIYGQVLGRVEDPSGGLVIDPLADIGRVS